MNLKKRLIGTKKAQTWSVDLVVGVVVFLLLVVILYALLSKGGNEDKELRLQSDQVLTRLDSSNSVTTGVPSLIVGEEINQTALEELYSSTLEYEEIKEKLGLTGEVCILVIDDTGGIIEVDASGVRRLSFGNSADNLTIADGKVCGN